MSAEKNKSAIVKCIILRHNKVTCFGNKWQKLNTILAQLLHPHVLFNLLTGTLMGLEGPGGPGSPGGPGGPG